MQNSLKLSIFGFLKNFPGWVLTAYRDSLLKLLPSLFLDPFPTGWKEKKGGSQRNSRTQGFLFYQKGVWNHSKQCTKVALICTGSQCRFWEIATTSIIAFATTSLLFDLVLNTHQETWILTTEWQRCPAREIVLNNQKGKKSCLGMQCEPFDRRKFKHRYRREMVGDLCWEKKILFRRYLLRNYFI